MVTAKTYEPKCLNFEDWPGHHQAAWMKALQKVDLFGEGGGGAHWRERSREKTRKGYGFWLYWNLCRGIDISLMPASDLVTQESVLAYVADLEAINSSMTVSCRIQELYDAIRVMFPPRRGGEDWRWLRTAMKNLHMNARSCKNKRDRLQPADKIEKLGLDLMAEAETAAKRKRGVGLTEIQRALMYRDGLMIALLIRRPFRLSNFCALRMDESLTMRGESASIAFDSDQTKTRRPIEAPFPPILHDALNQYIDVYRNVLLTASKKAKGIETDRLWISRDGTELSEVSLHNAIRRRTRDAFGAALPPHWFRDASVTTLIHDSPASARLTMGLLGHSTPEIGEKHYNQALMIDSARKYANCMEQLFSVVALDSGNLTE